MKVREPAYPAPNDLKYNIHDRVPSPDKVHLLSRPAIHPPQCPCPHACPDGDAFKARMLPSDSPLQATGVHSFSAASAGAIATMATHPFDVIKVREHAYIVLNTSRN